jgi:group I intron endonuclease
MKISQTGIYKIENVVNGTVYIGQSSRLKTREQLHFGALRSNRHVNKYLQNAFNKYGSENFCFSVILYCENFELTRYEQAILDKSKSVYNICLEVANSTRGVVRSIEHRNKLSKANKGKPAWNKGKSPSEETLIRLSKSHIGYKPTPEALINMSLAQKGKTRSEEDKIKYSIAKLGSKNPMYHKTVSEETRRKLTIARKLYWENRRGKEL